MICNNLSIEEIIHKILYGEIIDVSYQDGYTLEKALQLYEESIISRCKENNELDYEETGYVNYEQGLDDGKRESSDIIAYYQRLLEENGIDYE